MSGRWMFGFSPCAAEAQPRQHIPEQDLWHLQNTSERMMISFLSFPQRMNEFFSQLSGLNSLESNTFIFGSGISTDILV